MLWANLHLLFRLLLIPFVTSWMGTTEYARTPIVAYGMILLMSAIADFVMTQSLLAGHGSNSSMAQAISDDRKARISLVIYGLAIGAAFIHP